MIRSATLLALALVASSCGASPPESAVIAPIPPEVRGAGPPASTTAPPPTTTAPETPATTTSTTTTTGPDRGRIVIHGTGDVSLMNGHVRGTFGRHGYEYAWSGLDGLFERDSLTVVNLECTPSTLGAPRDKKFTFRCDLDALPVMRDSGVEVASMANNHAGDYGRAALLDGRGNLVRAGVRPVGAGRDLDQATRPAMITVDGWTIAVLGFSLVTGGEGWFAGPTWSGVAQGRTDTVIAAVTAAAEAADLVVVTVHWGEEGDHTPRGVNRTLATDLIGAGADIVFGHHSHRLNELEWVDGRPVFWGLGNFVWPDLGPFSSLGGVGEVVVEPDGTVSARLLRSEIVDDGHPVLLDPPDPALRSDRDATR
jgi:poly-gamma-glutamate synthesis protein (capsule biosynthesis protein)